MKTTNATPAIETKNLTKVYKNKTAVDRLNLTIEEGELFALLGVNGAGKTTTIRMLSRLSSPTEGEAKVFGHDVTKEPETIGYLIGISPQDTAVAEKMTVEENLKFMSDVYRRKKSVQKETELPNKDPSETKVPMKSRESEPLSNSGDRVNEIIRKMGLEEVRHTQARKLSGGWKRRLSIAMALIGEPRVLFLDEPTLGLDVLARRELWKVIEELKSTTTIILTTHYMEEAEALSDRIGILIGGKLIEVGTLPELEERTGKKGLEEVFLSVAENTRSEL